MTTYFLNALTSKDKKQSIDLLINDYRNNIPNRKIYELEDNAFEAIPGNPLAYWVSDDVRTMFRQNTNKKYSFRQGVATADDFRFLKSWWEISENSNSFIPISKGGKYSPWYQDLDLVIQWNNNGEQLLAFPKAYPRNTNYFGKPGITWPFRTAKGLNTRLLPRECAFTTQGMAAFHNTFNEEETWLLLAITNSTPFKQLLFLVVGAFAFQTGAMAQVPMPKFSATDSKKLIELAKEAYKLKKELDYFDETSHFFILPEKIILNKFSEINTMPDQKIISIAKKIDDIVFDAYHFNEQDKIDAIDLIASDNSEEEDENSEDTPNFDLNIDKNDALLSWAIGVAFNRFNIAFATTETPIPPCPSPFEPLPKKSMGALTDEHSHFHANAGILVDDSGNNFDIVEIINKVLTETENSVPHNIRDWIRKDFFVFHLQQYSKSRRKSPIYWPISTTSNNYTIWIYYPKLNDQTLYSIVNDFLDGQNGKLTQISRDCSDLRNKGKSRSHDEEIKYEMLQTFEQELTDLRDTLLKIAPTYQPNHDDGVQITAAPLWPLFRYKPWQKVLKDTWTKLEKGDYDWAHLAMAYWPNRVREKCKTNKSLAIAHGLEDQYEEPEAAPKKTRGRKKAGGEE